MWLAYTEQFPLDINDIVMRTKDWVEIQPLNPDRDVISRQFFKTGKNGGIIFKDPTLPHSLPHSQQNIQSVS